MTFIERQKKKLMEGRKAVQFMGETVFFAELDFQESQKVEMISDENWIEGIKARKHGKDLTTAQIMLMYERDLASRRFAFSLASRITDKDGNRLYSNDAELFDIVGMLVSAEGQKFIAALGESYSPTYKDTAEKNSPGSDSGPSLQEQQDTESEAENLTE